MDVQNISKINIDPNRYYVHLTYLQFKDFWNLRCSKLLTDVCHLPHAGTIAGHDRPGLCKRTWISLGQALQYICTYIYIYIYVFSTIFGNTICIYVCVCACRACVCLILCPIEEKHARRTSKRPAHPTARGVWTFARNSAAHPKPLRPLGRLEPQWWTCDVNGLNMLNMLQWFKMHLGPLGKGKRHYYTGRRQGQKVNALFDSAGTGCTQSGAGVFRESGNPKLNVPICPRFNRFSQIWRWIGDR